MKKTTTVTTYCAADASGRPCSIEYLTREDAVAAGKALGVYFVRETQTTITETTARFPQNR